MTPNTILAPVSSENIIALLATQKDNHIHLAEFVKSKSMKPAMVFLPQTMKMVDAELSNKEDLIMDCINFLDAIKIYSLSVYGDSECYLERIKHFLVENRTVNSINHSLAKDALDDFIFAKREDTMSFLDNNKLLLAIYVYSLINFILYSEA